MKFLDPGQHGMASFTGNLYTYDLALTLNNKSRSDIIYFVFAEAFDSVSHDLILRKLEDEFQVNKMA